MRKVLGLVGATMLFAGSAVAADLSNPVYKAPAVAAPAPLWSGFYLGIHGGYGWGNESMDTAVGDFTTFSNPSPRGGVFGGQAGYNWQYGTFVGGLEVDVSAADLNDSQSFAGPFAVIRGIPFGSATETLSSKVDFFGSARARAGFLLMPDWLFYGTAGLAWAHDSLTHEEAITLGNLTASASDTAFNDHIGWAAGAGVEYRLWQNFLLRAEYLHYGFGSATYNFNDFASVNSKLSIDVVRGGLSYKF
jgi:opacity protein-like surface antigen